MSDCIEDGGFWLPAQFFDDSDDSELCFPTEFPYDVEIEKGKSPEGGRSLMPTSPQSPLVDGRIWPAGSSNVSPNGVASPPLLKDGNDAVGELINQAAGQVARLKLDGGVGPRPTNINGLMAPPVEPTGPIHLYPNASSTVHNIGNGNEPKKGTGVWYTDPQRGVVGAGYCPRPVYPNLNPARVLVPESRAIPVVGGGAVPNKSRTGTGFFLPRRYGNINNGLKDNKVYSMDSRKKTATGTGNSSGYYNNDNNNSDRNLNKNNHNGNGYCGVPHQPNLGFASDYELLVARRDAVMKEYGDYYIPKGWDY